MNEKRENQILIYKTENGQYNVEVLLKDDTVWLTQKQMAELFDKGRTTITEHIQNTFKRKWGQASTLYLIRKTRYCINCITL